jgi:hypothetical protein
LAIFLLLGLCHNREIIDQLIQGVREMEESSTYQLILERGEARALRETILRQGTKRFGPPSPAVSQTLQDITELDRLQALTDRLLDVSNWEALLA